MNFVIYFITNLLDGRIYIGATKNFDKRKKEHLNKLKKDKHENIFLQRAWNKDGKNNFSIEIKFYFKSSEEMYNKEVELINELQNLYNLAKGGFGGDIFSTLPVDKQNEIILFKSNQTKEFIKLGIIPKPKKFNEYLEGEDLEKQLKVWSECKRGIKNGRFKYSEKVYQLDCNYNVVKIWDLLCHLKYQNTYTYQYVRKCCLKIPSFKQHKNFYWMFESDYKIHCEG